ncbi:outer membrane beta-barrel protein [Alkanindiges illinoisensis]|uniref:outer membrane beta-barrel protein n=1 Tax=Alkanindiges illinoisensis TaxID=197183 RepID=UPI00047BB897|nr:outer membrane beta-barrel protein [Alkanindiges illinoisensis]
MLKQLSLLTLTLITTSSFAATLQYQPFVDLGIGQTTVKNFCDGLEDAPVSCDDKDTTFRIGGGLMFNDNISAELTYLNFGKATVNGSLPGIITAQAEAKISAIALQVGAYAPLNPQFSVYGKLGPAVVNGEFKTQIIDYTGYVGSENTEESDSQVEALFTVGASYQFSPALSANLQLDYIPQVGDDDEEEGSDQLDLQTFTLGLKYKF